MNESDLRSDVHYLGSSENKALTVYSPKCCQYICWHISNTFKVSVEECKDCTLSSDQPIYHLLHFILNYFKANKGPT